MVWHLLMFRFCCLVMTFRPALRCVELLFLNNNYCWAPWDAPMFFSIFKIIESIVFPGESCMFHDLHEVTTPKPSIFRRKTIARQIRPFVVVAFSEGILTIRVSEAFKNQFLQHLSSRSSFFRAPLFHGLPGRVLGARMAESKYNFFVTKIRFWRSRGVPAAGVKFVC